MTFREAALFTPRGLPFITTPQIIIQRLAVCWLPAVYFVYFIPCTSRRYLLSPSCWFSWRRCMIFEEVSWDDERDVRTPLIHLLHLLKLLMFSGKYCISVLSIVFFRYLYVYAITLGWWWHKHINCLGNAMSSWLFIPTILSFVSIILIPALKCWRPRFVPFIRPHKFINVIWITNRSCGPTAAAVSWIWHDVFFHDWIFLDMFSIRFKIGKRMI